MTTGPGAECVALSVMTAGILLMKYHDLLYGAVDRQEYGYHVLAGQTVQVNTFLHLALRMKLKH